LQTRTGSPASDDDGARFLGTETSRPREQEKEERRERMGVRFDPVTFVEHREALRDRESVR